jgi:uncharacterized membrane protein YqhA
MARTFALLIAGIRYVFVLAVLALASLSLASLVRGIGEMVYLLPGSGFAAAPGGSAAAVPWFIQSVFLYFLAVAVCSLFVAEPPVPQWMIVRNLFQFRNKVLAFVAVILPLMFLGKVLRTDVSGPGVLYWGAGVFLVLAGIFLLVRQGSPAGDDGLSRDGNRPPERGGRRDRSAAQSGGRDLRKDRPWAEGRKESPSRSGEIDQEGPADVRKNGNVTVKPGPRRPRRR